ncbi:hypothetical protein [Methylobacterium sp. Gmos1]
MASVIVPFALATGRQERSPAHDPAVPLPAEGAAPGRRVPAEAILAVGRRIRLAASLPEAAPTASRPRMQRKHKLMLVTAAAVLYLGGSEARRNFKPRATLIEVPDARGNAIAALPAPRSAA